MKLTKREQELNQATQKGRRDFEWCSYDPKQYTDKGMQEAYIQGWQIARANYNTYYS